MSRRIPPTNLLIDCHPPRLRSPTYNITELTQLDHSRRLPLPPRSAIIAPGLGALLCVQDKAERSKGKARPLIENELRLGGLLGNFLLSLTSASVPHICILVHAELRFLIRYPLIDCSLSKDHGEQVPRLAALDAERLPDRLSGRLRAQPGLRQLLPPPVAVQQRIPPHRHAVLARGSLSGLSQGESRIN